MNSISPVIYDVLREIFHTFIPRVCTICSRELLMKNVQSGMCDDCTENIEILPPESLHCWRREEECFVCAVYSGRIAATLIHFKKGRLPKGGQLLAGIFLTNIRNYIHSLNISAGEIVFTHPPPSFHGQLTRGYDHMNRFCRSLARYCNFTARVVKLFSRNVSASQKMLDRKSRKINMLHAVSLRRSRSKILHHETSIIIIDDVITTGATLNQCRELLKKEGFCNVYCVALLTD